MANRARINPYKIFNVQSIATGTTAAATSAITNVANFCDIGIVVEWAQTTTPPVGTIDVQVQNGNSAWSSLSLSSTTTVSGASGSLNISIAEFNFEKIKLVYNRTSGDGTLTATLVARSRG